jgi:hypothetical protein
LEGEIEDHFRNICESYSPVFDNNEPQQNSPKFNRPDGDDDELLGDLGNSSMDEGVRAITTIKAKKLKKKPRPHYLV